MRPVAAVPIIVARGMVRAGSWTLSAAALADSKPSSAHSVSAAVAVMPAPVKPWAGKGATCAVPVPSVRASSARTTTIGTSLIMVVTICVRPTVRAPSRLTPVISQRKPIDTIAPMPGWLRAGTRLLRLAVTATAIVTLDVMTDSQ